MTLVDQHNKAKGELTTLYKMMELKIESIRGVAPRSEVRRVEHELLLFKNMLENYFDFYNLDRNNSLLVGCTIADRLSPDTLPSNEIK